MLYTKNVKDAFLLEVELKRIKLLYANILEQSEDRSILKDLRRRIKELSRRISILHQESFHSSEVSL